MSHVPFFGVGAHIEIAVGHLAQQPGSVDDDGLQDKRHVLEGFRQAAQFILRLIGDGDVEVAFHDLSGRLLQLPQRLRDRPCQVCREGDGNKEGYAGHGQLQNHQILLHIHSAQIVGLRALLCHGADLDEAVHRFLHQRLIFVQKHILRIHHIGFGCGDDGFLKGYGLLYLSGEQVQQFLVACKICHQPGGVFG